MATYLMLANFTDQGIRNFKGTVKRAEAFKELAKGAGVTGQGSLLGPRSVRHCCDRRCTRRHDDDHARSHAGQIRKRADPDTACLLG